MHARYDTRAHKISYVVYITGSDLYTGQPCYNNDVRGIGFSGISLVGKAIL